MLRPLCILLAVSLFIIPAAPAQQPVELTVHSGREIKPIDPLLYGHFLEDIYHSVNGGLYGEVVWNRSFEEDLPRPGGRRGGGRRGRRGGAATTATAVAATPSPVPTPEPTPLPNQTPARHWTKVRGIEASGDAQNPLNSARSLKLTASEAGMGIQQGAFALRAGDPMRGSLWVRGEAPEGLLVRFLDGANTVARQSIPAPGAAWKEIPLDLTPSSDATSATLQIITQGKAAVWLDQVSLMPQSFADNGGFRPDLLAAVEGLKPTSLRWPGGSFVGNNGGYRWKGGVGPQAQRVGKVGWDELEPFAFGTDEFISLCKRVGAEPVIVVYLGSREPGADHAELVQEAADWVEYCNGPASSTWGAKRAANGHPEPYGVKYWEVDNEIWNMDANDYVRVVKEFDAAMKKVDPAITTIACGSGGFASRFGEGDIAVIEQIPDVVKFLSIHHYESVGGYADGPARAEAYFNELGARIEKSKNPGFKLYMSEWNLQSTDWRTGLYAGGILNVMERNKYVTMACPALFLRHDSAPAWDNSFINFNQTGWFPAPNYIIMKLWRDYFEPVQVAMDGGAEGLNAIATKSTDGSRLVVKLVNPTDAPMTIDLKADAAFPVAQGALKLVAPDNLDARNTLQNREAVRVADGQLTMSNGAARFTLPRWSAGVVELKK